MNIPCVCLFLFLGALGSGNAWPWTRRYPPYFGGYMNRFGGGEGLSQFGGGEGGSFGGGEGGGFGNFGGGEGGSQFGGGEGGSQTGGGEGGGGGGGDDEAAEGGQGGGGGEGASQSGFPRYPYYPSYQGYNNYNPLYNSLGYGRNPYFGRNPTFPYFGRYGGQQSWWRGPNVCRNVTETEDDKEKGENSRRISHHFSIKSIICDESEVLHKCTKTLHEGSRKKTLEETYECCHGYTRKRGDFGCPKVLTLRHLPQTLKSLSLNRLRSLLDSTSLTEELQEGTFTIFAPVDEAFNSTQEGITGYRNVNLQDIGRDVVVISKPVSRLVVPDIRNVLLGHLSEGVQKSSSFSDEQLIPTASPFQAKIRINIYSQPKQVVTANCARLLSSDNLATNGVVHTVERVLEPITESLIDHIGKNPQLSYLKTALARANLVQTLRQDGQFTLFAPTDNAFKKLDRTRLDRLLRGDSTCLQKVLKNHVLPNVICSAVLQGRAKTPNLLHKYIRLTRDKDGKLFAQGSQIIEKDVMATNGVLYIIDDVLLPDEALSVLDIAGKNNFNKLLEAAKQARMTKTLISTRNMTLFAPTDEAFENLPVAVQKQLRDDPQLLADILRYHIVPFVKKCNSFYNNDLLDTLKQDKKIRINEYMSFPFGRIWKQTVQCTPIVKRNIPACNGIIHVIDKVLIPPRGNLMDILASDRQFSTLVSFVKRFQLADELQGEGPFTVFAPTNDVFNKLGEQVLRRLQDSPDELKTVLQNHVTKRTLCCAGIFEQNWFSQPHIKMLSGNSFSVSRTKDVPNFGQSEITECDQMATNGIIHVINRVILKPEPKFSTHRGFDFSF